MKTLFQKSQPFKEERKIIVFFDATCGFCTNFNLFLFRRGKNKNMIYFSPQTSNRFKKLSRFIPKKCENSIGVYDVQNMIYYCKTNAISFLFAQLRAPWCIIGYILKILPLCASDTVYGYISKKRHSFSNSCSYNRSTESSLRAKFENHLLQD